MNRLSLILISILLWTGCQKSSRISSDERVIPVQIVEVKKAKMAKAYQNRQDDKEDNGEEDIS